jgi:hypothetical protein
MVRFTVTYLGRDFPFIPYLPLDSTGFSSTTDKPSQHVLFAETYLPAEYTQPYSSSPIDLNPLQASMDYMIHK